MSKKHLSARGRDEGAEPDTITYEAVRDLCRSLDQKDPFYPKVYIVWMAMTDWITAVPDTKAFLKILHQEIKNELTKENLERRREGFRNHYGVSGVLWKAETLAGLEGLFTHYPDSKTLDEIFLAFDEEVKTRI